MSTTVDSILNESTIGVTVSAHEDITGDDAAWALTCAFLILTMQTGFAMLECGCVSSKNMANIMIKNVCDVSIGGLSYWMLGYGLTFGSNPATCCIGWGDFFYTEERLWRLGSGYSKYFFQFSFASTATTIVSGAVAERMKLHAYMIFSFLNVIVYSIPAAWCWGENGWLGTRKFFDFAGVCVVHLNGGASALVAAWMLGPRKDRWTNPDKYVMSSPVTALTGMFMLTWAWLGFNCGSTFGVSNNLWKVSAFVAVTTLNGAIGGGLTGICVSMIVGKKKVFVDYVINSLLGGLVAVTGICAVTSPIEALFIGAIGGLIAVSAGKVMDFLKVDDPVGAVPVHFFTSIWGTMAVGIFGKDNIVGSLRGVNGILHGGSFHLLGINTLAAVCVATWAAAMTFIMLFVIDKIMGIRMSEEEELLGADWVEHDIKNDSTNTKLDALLANLSDDHWGDVMGKLLHEVTANDQVVKRRSSAGGHRIWGADRTNNARNAELANSFDEKISQLQKEQEKEKTPNIFTLRNNIVTPSG